MSEWTNRCHFGDCLETMRRMPDGIAQTCVTSPPYFGLRDYGHEGQIGLEETPAAFVAKLVEVFREVRRLLKDDGTLWLNLGDSYANDGKWGGSSGGKHASALHGATNIGRGKKTTGLKSKNLIGIPWRVAFALQADGWYLRQDVIWSKPNAMPSPTTDRCTSSHEYIFLLAKQEQYYFDHKAIREEAVSDHPSGNGFKRPERVSFQNEDGSARGNEEQWTDVGGQRNKRSVWTVATTPYKGAHFATFPTELIEPCVLAGAPAGGVVLDPFFGSGTTGQVAQNLGRAFIGCELNPAYEALQAERLSQMGLVLESA